MIGQSHPTGLTNSLLKLFEPRPPLEFKPPPEKRQCLPLTGMAQFVNKIAEPNDPEYAPPIPTVETPVVVVVNGLLTIAGYEECQESWNVRLVTDQESGEPRGYAFTEISRECHAAAYKQADGRKIDGRRVLVDVERGTTIPNWRPRRLVGRGLGTSIVKSTCSEYFKIY